MSHDPHLSFIIAAYALGFLIISSMVALIVADYLNLKRALATFAERQASQEPKASREPQASREMQDSAKHAGSRRDENLRDLNRRGG